MSAHFVYLTETFIISDVVFLDIGGVTLTLIGAVIIAVVEPPIVGLIFDAPTGFTVELLVVTSSDELDDEMCFPPLLYFLP